MALLVVPKIFPSKLSMQDSIDTAAANVKSSIHPRYIVISSQCPRVSIPTTIVRYSLSIIQSDLVQIARRHEYIYVTCHIHIPLLYIQLGRYY